MATLEPKIRVKIRRFLVQVGEFGAYTPEELLPVVITELGRVAPQETSAQGQNVSDQKTNPGYGFPESLVAPEVPLRLGAPTGALELYKPFRGALVSTPRENQPIPPVRPCAEGAPP